MLEADLALTADGAVVLSHNPFLSPDIVRTQEKEYVPDQPLILIHDLTLSELRTYDVGRLNPHTSYGQRFPEQVAVDGQTIPTLGELFDLTAATAPSRNDSTRERPPPARR